MTPAIIGGLLLIVGAFFTYRGEIFYSVFAYFTADICWIILSWSSGDIIGTLMVSLGMILGIGAFIKMRSGKMHKTLKKDRN